MTNQEFWMDNELTLVISQTIQEELKQLYGMLKDTCMTLTKGEHLKLKNSTRQG